MINGYLAPPDPPAPDLLAELVAQWRLEVQLAGPPAGPGRVEAMNRLDRLRRLRTFGPISDTGIGLMIALSL
jgi:hypothetical protein